MGIQENIENLKGKAKEKAGEHTDNPDLQDEGRADQASARAKDSVDRAADAIGDKIDSVKDKFNKK